MEMSSNEQNKPTKFYWTGYGKCCKVYFLLQIKFQSHKFESAQALSHIF